MTHKILIVDGSNLAHRCRHTFNLSFQGMDVSVTYGFLRTLHSTMLRHAPDVVIVCWDGGAPEYRRTYCPTYKQCSHADDDTYEEFLEQVIELQELLPIFGVASVRRVSCEADDLMYHAAMLLQGEKIILTTDQDLYQAVLGIEDTVVHSPVKDIEVSKENFEEVTGVKPIWDWWMTYRAMVGDGSDGIPGVNGVGPKRALQLVEEFDGSAAAIINAANGVGDPDKHIRSLSIASKLGLFGISGFKNAYVVSRLDKDRCGARKALLDEFSLWQTYDHEEVKAFLVDYAFVSLQEPEFYRSFKSLRSPSEALLHDNLRIPLVAPVRD